MASKPFEARYYNKRCPQCGWPVEAGEMAQFNDNGEFVHERCCDDEISNPYFDNWWNRAPQDVRRPSAPQPVPVTAPHPLPQPASTMEEDEPVIIYCYLCGERLEVKPLVRRMRFNSNGYLMVEYFQDEVLDHRCQGLNKLATAQDRLEAAR